MFRFRILGIALLPLSLAFAPAAHAQLFGLNHVWTVPGLIEGSANLSTVVTCTNTSTSNVTVGVEVYGPNGGYITGDSAVAPASGTVMLATGAVPNLALDVNLNSGAVAKGQGRILASTSKGILCNAFLADATSGVPTIPLAIVKRIAQKGD